MPIGLKGREWSQEGSEDMLTGFAWEGYRKNRPDGDETPLSPSGSRTKGSAPSATWRMWGSGQSPENGSGTGPLWGAGGKAHALQT